MSDDQPRVGHIADRHRPGKAVCGVDLPPVRLGAEPARRAVFCTACEDQWSGRRDRSDNTS